LGDLVAEFRINISNLSEGIHEYSFEVPTSKIGLDDRFRGLIKVQVKLDKSLRQILLQSSIEVGSELECDRCLENFQRQVNTSYSLVYIQGDRSTVEVKKEEEIQVLSTDTNYIDLDEDVRQYILLDIPQKLLCKDDCQGLCPICGVNKNVTKCDCSVEVVDSRWDALKKLSPN
jgi:uncharacterized protein